MMLTTRMVEERRMRGGVCVVGSAFWRQERTDRAGVGVEEGERYMHEHTSMTEVVV